MYRLRITHETSYFYREPVRLLTHTAMLRPREGHDLHIDEARLDISPDARVRWVRDIYGNSIAIFDFEKPCRALRVSSECVVTVFDDTPEVRNIAPHARSFPFLYPPDEQIEIIPFRLPGFPKDGLALKIWLEPIIQPGEIRETLEFLKLLNTRIFESFAYERREEPGVRSPAETIRLGSGSCRDFAVFFVETARLLGLAARFVTGYILIGEKQHGATHAWAEVYLPGAGWIGFDPTNNKPAGGEHVSVAVARDHEKASPLSGSYAGSAEAFERMEIMVRVFRDSGP